MSPKEGQGTEERGTKLARLQALMARGDWHGALRIAARFPRLGEHRVAIQRAWAAIVNPRLYEGMGYDLEAVKQDGIRALKERYGG
jgi:hypothetical protein